MKKVLLRSIARTLILCMGYELVFPVAAYALTSGPSQPEVQSFEPVGTTEMVDMFTGDFTYNVPLMDVEGFPINISYHGGVNIEQEASWVGLGWNINPGEINRAVRGLPDDFNGETIEKTIHIEEEVNYRVGMGVSASLEIFGFNPSQYGLNLSIGVGNYIAYSNYKGMSVGGNIGVTVSTPIASAGVDVGVGSQSGADVDLNAGLHLPMKITQDAGAGIGVTGSTGFNSRSGLKDLSFGVNITTSITTTGKVGDKDKYKEKRATTTIPGQSFGSSIPIGLQNYVPVITNPSVQKTFQFQARFGGEVFYVFPNAHMSIMKSTLKFEEDGSRKGYGYLYSEDAPEDGIMDFSREKDGYYNSTLKNLPLSSMTYDVYAISGQGTGGVFRPFRNDIGSVHDPLVAPPKSTTTDLKIEAGIGNIFEIGTDMTFYDNETKSGPWKRFPFRGKEVNNLFEKSYFKQAGELTYNNQQLTTALFNTNPQYLYDDDNTLKGIGSSASMPGKLGGSFIYTGSNTDRTARANVLNYITGEESDIKDVAHVKKVISYTNNGSNPFCNPSSTEYNRYGTNSDQAKKHHLTELTQTLPDGRRYVYGIPAMNHVTKEVSFGVTGSKANINTGIVEIDRSTSDHDDSKNNKKGKEHFYSYTGTPAYAYSYLLTSVLSNDYVDVLGDGPSDDDLGAFTKINYTKWDDDYRWRAPYNSDSAQYNPGFWCDVDDDKGNYIMGSKDIWHIRSIETKNFVAEFYVSTREDAKGISSSILSSGSTIDVSGKYAGSKTSNGGQSYSYKLDSIKLYNKHDRYINENSAVPIKTVVFRYSYNLCPGIPNTFSSSPSTAGKLTLERIYIKYGNSQKNLLSPYVFTYNGNNPRYNFACKDRWGNYKPSDPSLGNYEFPYVSQDPALKSDNDANAASWSLTDIKLPSGGKIHVDYESDDYSYVQDRRAMDMFKVEGFGSSSNKDIKSTLYESVDRVNDYVYFKRRISKENTSLSIRENYLENAQYLYYSFNLDISGTGRYEHIKGYALIDDAGICPNDADYGWVKLKKEKPGNKSDHLFHPATIYGLNIGRRYLPHIIYPGFKNGNSGPIQIMQGLKAAGTELLTITKNPIVRFVEKDKKAKNVTINKSWIRLHTPGLTKQGGGIRVKQLTLNDAWSTLTSNPADANYGKVYDYTVWDAKWNKNISSGVASYEPSIGGDENPFKLPVKYTEDAGRLLPAIEFFQEEPFGESFFPPPVVGYSKVRVSSIHASTARSSQSEEEYSFYTAKDFPIQVNYTGKDAPGMIKKKTLRKKYQEERVMQGYSLCFNDMHGKLRSSNVYIIKTDGTNRKRELVTGMTYNYQLDAKGQLNNTVNAVVRDRGSDKNMSIQSIRLGEEVDFTIDSRERDVRSYSRNVDINCNVVLFGFIPVPIPTAFFPDKEEKVIFKSMVSTKIVQRYGILKSVENYDHGAKTVTENLLYDSETGGVLLTRTNNEYKDDIYKLRTPAFWAYTCMGPAYVNINYEEDNDTLILQTRSGISGYNPTFYADMLVKHKERFFPGDELLLSYKIGGTDHQVKVWVDDNYQAPIQHPLTYLNAPYPGVNNLPLPLDIRVVPRYIFKNGVAQWPGSPTVGDTITGVAVKVLRSGRRNNLDKDVQTTEFTQNPYSTNIGTLIGNYSSSSPAAAYANVINTVVKKYSDYSVGPYFSDSAETILPNYPLSSANPHYYKPNIYPVNKFDGSDTFQVFNKFVLGHAGNYRQCVEGLYRSKRNYANNSARLDGTYSIQNKNIWFISSNGERSLIWASSGGAIEWMPENWVASKIIRKYDVFGNAIEEQDASGKVSSAQYEYNKSLPVAVANNVSQDRFFFEGFEDYNNLRPDLIYNMFGSSHYYHTPFSKYFKTSLSTLTRYNQKYVRTNLVDTDTITSVVSHTGKYSLRCYTAKSFNLKLKGSDAWYMKNYSYIRDFGIDTNKKYIISLWLKPVGGTYADAETVASNTEMAVTDNTMSHLYSFQLKTGSIDGWYKAECIIDPRVNVIQVEMFLSANAYYDDIRFIPLDATMKSFVYDPLSFKLQALLDENNFATFYEYDQEGLLIRTKKETDRGIMTIGENRRSNSKK